MVEIHFMPQGQTPNAKRDLYCVPEGLAAQDCLRSQINTAERKGEKVKLATCQVCGLSLFQNSLGIDLTIK